MAQTSDSAKFVVELDVTKAEADLKRLFSLAGGGGGGGGVPGNPPPGGRTPPAPGGRAPVPGRGQPAPQVIAAGGGIMKFAKAVAAAVPFMESFSDALVVVSDDVKMLQRAISEDILGTRQRADWFRANRDTGQKVSGMLGLGAAGMSVESIGEVISAMAPLEQMKYEGLRKVERATLIRSAQRQVDAVVPLAQPNR